MHCSRDIADDIAKEYPKKSFITARVRDFCVKRVN